MTIASIDIGTNTILLLIVKVNSEINKIKVIFEDQKIPRIGKWLKPGFPISKKKEELLVEILESFKTIARKFECERIIATATNAFRIASNREALVERIREQLDIEVNVVEGNEEARLTFLGCTYHLDPRKKYAVIDIGGGSTEIISGSKDKIDCDTSLQLGVVSLTEKYFLNDPPSVNEVNLVRSEIQFQLKKSVNNSLNYEKVMAVAGTPTTLVCIKKELEIYDEQSIEGAILSYDEVKEFSEKLSLMSSKNIKHLYKSVVDGREDVLLTGTILLEEIMTYIDVDEVAVSTQGLRYGAVYDFLSKSV
jgi:exopolyphosphatase/guanosine-5'-triphosphate,3'-diphosphate pyrophosphatase